jgi:cytochrome c556
MKRLIMIVISLVMVAGGLGAAYGQFAKPGQAIEYRRAVMVLNGVHFGRMGAMVKGQTAYNKDEFIKNARLIETFSRMPWEAFMVPGTDKHRFSRNDLT